MACNNLFIHFAIIEIIIEIVGQIAFNIAILYVGDERTPELLLGFAGIPQLCNLD